MFNGLHRNSTSITSDGVTLRLVLQIPRSCTMNSSLKVHWEPSDETLFRYRGTQTVRFFNLLTLRVTASCSPSWTSTTIKTYSSFILFIFVAESKLYTYLIALLLQKKKQTNKIDMGLSQIWYPINSLKKTVRFELLLAETRHFFSE